MSRINWFTLVRLRWKVAFSVPKNMGDEDAIVWLQNPSELNRVIGNTLSPDLRLPLNVYVDHSQSIEEMVRAAGCVCKNSHISSGNFPKSRKGIEDVRVQPVALFTDMDENEILNHFLKLHMRHARIETLLAFWKKYPKKIEDEPLIAFGSHLVADGNMKYPYIRNGVIDLSHVSKHGKWSENSWVLAEIEG